MKTYIFCKSDSQNQKSVKVYTFQKCFLGSKAEQQFISILYLGDVWLQGRCHR